MDSEPIEDMEAREDVALARMLVRLAAGGRLGDLGLFISMGSGDGATRGGVDGTRNKSSIGDAATAASRGCSSSSTPR